MRPSFVVSAFALTALAAGCSTANTAPSAAPRVLVTPTTDAPRIDNSDAAGAASVPGYHSVTPEPATVSPNTR